MARVISFVIACLTLVFFCAATTIAKERIAAPTLGRDSASSQTCAMKESGTISVNFNNLQSPPDQIKTLLDQKIADVEAMAKELGFKKFEIQSYNYNSYSNNNGGSCGNDGNTTYQSSGNISFTIEPSDAGPALLAKLRDKGLYGNLSVNAYRQCE